MKLILKSSSTIQEIQQAFQQHFSHLKIEFYKKPHHTEEGNAKKEQYLHNVTLAEITQHSNDLELTINPSMPTGEFEASVEKNHQLHIQVLRLQRGTWLQTTHTDMLSLQEQNEKGIQADIDIEPESPADIDYQ
jgi:hypothetical protein